MSNILGPELLKLYKLSINLAYFSGSIPFKWCEHKDGIYYVKSSHWNPFTWTVIKYVVFINQLYIIIRLCQRISEIPADQHISSLIPQFAYTFGHFVPTIAQISLMHQGQKIRSVAHQCITFSIDFQDRYSDVRRGGKIPPAQMVIGVYIVGIFTTVLFSILAVIVYTIKYPKEKLLVTTIILTPEFVLDIYSTWWKLSIKCIIDVLPLIPALTSTLACAVTGLISLHSIISILKELKFNNKRSLFTPKSLKNPWNYLHTSKVLAVLGNRINSIIRWYLLFFNNLMTSSSVGSQVVYITFRSKFVLEARIGLVILAIGSTIYMIVVYFKLGFLNEVSRKTIASWKAVNGIGMTNYDKKLFKKYVKSQQALRVNVGEFGYYQKATSARIIGKLIYYTTKGLVLTRKFV